MPTARVTAVTTCIIAGSIAGALTTTPSAALARSTPPPTPACGTATDSFPDAAALWEAISGNPELTTFTELADVAGVMDDIAGGDGVTVLVPSDGAFDAIPANVLDSLLADAELVSTVVAHHMIPGAATPGELAAAGVVTSTAGADVTFAAEGERVGVDGIATVCGFAGFDGGVVVVIDAVLMPPAGDPGSVGSSVPTSAPVPALTGEEADVATAFETAVDSSLTYDEQAPFIEDAESIRSTIENYPAAADAVLGITATVTSVDIDGDTAAITYTLAFNGVATPYGELDGTMIRVDGSWVVPLDEYCAFQAQARNACPA